MRRALVVLCLLGGAMFPPDAVVACGDKFLVLGRGAKRVPRARHAATILLYLRPGSDLPLAAKEMRLEATLRQAGHNVEAVAEEASMREALANRRHDLVLVDPKDASAVGRAAETGVGEPEVVPVAYKATPEMLRAAQTQHALVVKTGKDLSYLATLDQRMGQRAADGASR